jgi:hypothetical protein
VRTEVTSALEESRDILVASVEELNMLSVPPPSVELRVEAMLFFEGDRRKKLAGREGAARPGLTLRLTDLVEEFDPAHNRPRNLVAADPMFSDGVTE